MIDLRKQNVLLFTRTMQLGGTENVILQLCEILQPKVCLLYTSDAADE